MFQIFKYFDKGVNQNNLTLFSYFVTISFQNNSFKHPLRLCYVVHYKWPGCHNYKQNMFDIAKNVVLKLIV